MADSEVPDRRAMARQARQRLDSLRAAGIEWLPAPPATGNVERNEPAMASTSAGGNTGLLFEVAPAGPAPAPAEQRRQALEMLAGSIANCPRCAELLSTRTQTVFGVGRVDPEICFVGEAPGADEDAQGEPFVGAAGQLLNRIIIACGMKREEVYICNIIKCRPPGNRTPLPNEAANCREYLEKQLELVRPKFICALGACAAQNLLGTTLSVGRLRGQFHDYRGIPVLCTYHPAYLLRSPDKKREVWEDMKKLLERLGRPILAK